MSEKRGAVKGEIVLRLKEGGKPERLLKASALNMSPRRGSRPRGAAPTNSLLLILAPSISFSTSSAAEASIIRIKYQPRALSS